MPSFLKASYQARRKTSGPNQFSLALLWAGDLLSLGCRDYRVEAEGCDAADAGRNREA